MEWPIRTGTPPGPTTLRDPMRDEITFAAAHSSAPRSASHPALARAGSPARRLAAAALDLSLAADARVTDRVRASVETMRDGLVDGVERAMRRAILPYFDDEPELAASLSSASVNIARPLLDAAGTLSHLPLVAILLRRAEEAVLAGRLSPVRGLAGLPVDDTDTRIAAAAEALLVADARRLDPFGEPVMLLDDLPAELAGWLAWHVAAALRHYLVAHHGVAGTDADALLIPAVTALLRDHDEGRGLYAVAAWLADRLAADARIDGALLASFVHAGQLPAFVAALATIVAIPGDEVWPLVADPTDGRLATALRAADVERDAAAEILLRLIPAGGDPAAEIAFFDDMDPAGAADALLPLAAPADYRAAIRALGLSLAEVDA